jgi:DNA-binding GntR family transcriptional regulator
LSDPNTLVTLRRLNDLVYLTHGPGWFVTREGKGVGSQFVLFHFSQRVRAIGHTAATADEVLLERIHMGKGQRRAATR